MTVPFVHTKLIQAKPVLVAFHERLTAQLFPSGRSENGGGQATGMLDNYHTATVRAAVSCYLHIVSCLLCMQARLPH